MTLVYLCGISDPFLEMFSFPHVPVFLPKLETCLTTRKGPTFKHCEAGYPVILPTKAQKGMSTTGRILGTNGVGHVGPIFVSGQST